MSRWKDQSGRPVTFDQLVDGVAEAILANLIAFDRAGVRRGEVQQIVGRDGGTHVGRGAMLQTPIVPPLTQEEGHTLFVAYRDLLNAYDRGEIAESVVADLVDRNSVEKKAQMLRDKFGEDE